MNIELTADGSHYKVGARTVPRVTTILNALRLQYTPDDPAALARGTAVHAAICFMLENRLDMKTVDDICLPYVIAAQRVIADLKIKPIAIEKPIVSSLGYAGRPDLICTFGDSPERCAWDWKTGKVQAAGALQLVAYAGASSSAPIGRIACELTREGTYNVIAFPAKDWYADWRCWLGCISVYQWISRRKHANPAARASRKENQ
jgi:hypothetical protein